MRKNKPLFFTKHQLGRMAQRGMSKAIVNVVVKFGEWSKGKEPYSFQIEYNGVIVVLYEQRVQYNVSSCKLNRLLTMKAEKIKEQKGITFYKAMHRVVKSIDFSQELAEIS
jgi:hypothetical protein